jgi:hypothetical protein
MKAEKGNEKSSGGVHPSREATRWYWKGVNYDIVTV